MVFENQDQKSGHVTMGIMTIQGHVMFGEDQINNYRIEEHEYRKEGEILIRAQMEIVSFGPEL